MSSLGAWPNITPPRLNSYLQRAAEQAGLPVSALIRVWALDRLHAESEGGGGAVAERALPGWSARSSSAPSEPRDWPFAQCFAAALSALVE